MIIRRCANRGMLLNNAILWNLFIIILSILTKGMIRLSEEKIFYVYKWIRLDTNQVFYVGKGKGQRYKDRSMRNKYFNNVVNKVSINNINIEIIENNLDEKTAFEREKFYIQHYKELGYKLTNMTSGGEGSSDWYTYLSEEEKEHHRQISKSFLGKCHTEETKKKRVKL